MPEAKTTGTMIAHLRGLRRWTQQRLADELGVHQTTVARWERDQMEVGSANLRRLARLFAVPMETLLPR